MSNSQIVQVVGKCNCGQNFVKYVHDEMAYDNNYHPSCPNCLRVVDAFTIIDPLEIETQIDVVYLPTYAHING